MKKHKKLLLTATTAISAVTVATPIITNTTNSRNVVNNDVEKVEQQRNASVDSSDIVFNDKIYSSIEDATNDFLTQNGVVTQKLYLGDVNDAISSNDYNTVNLNKLKEVTSTNVSKAYKTLTDDYTSDLTEAKKSYLQNPVIKWTDKDGNTFDSEYEAKQAMANNGDAYTNPVGYYEVNDYSRLDSYGRPTVVKINPLNSTDQAKLKEIAARNMLLNQSSFSIDRLSVDAHKNETVYSSTGNFTGQDNAFINNMVNDVAIKLMDTVRENLPLNVKVNAIADKKTMVLTHYTKGGAIFGNQYKTETVPIYYDTVGYNGQAVTFANDIRNDAKFFSTKDGQWGNKFKMVDAYAKGNYKPATDFVALDNQTVLGGQNLKFTLHDGENITTRYRYYYVPALNTPTTKYQMINSGDFGFLGKGYKNTAYFQFEINQYQLNSQTLNNASQSVKNNLIQRQQTVKQTVTENLKNELKNWGFPDDEAMRTAEEIGSAAGSLLFDNVMGSEKIYTPTLANATQVDFPLSKLNAMIVSKLDENLKKSGQASLTDTLTKYLTLKYQAREQVNSNNDIYVVEYNGAPLFKLDQSLVSGLYNNSDFKVNPLDTVKKSFNQSLSNNYSSFVNTLVNGMTNISNSFKISANNQVALTKNAIDNYGTSSNEFNFGFDNSTNNSGFDSSVKLFDSNIFASNNIQTSQLEKQLNRREDDNQSNLNSQFGTFEAVYQYNKNLSEILSNTDASDALKNNVNKNALKNVNDVIVLYDKTNKPATIKYGEYLDYGYKFNESLSDGNIRIISSDEKRKYEIDAEGLNVPSKQYTYFDYNGNVLLKENVEAINGSYDIAAQQVYLNALNKIVVPASSQYVFYTNLDGSQELVKNQTTKLNVLKITDGGKDYYYGFTKYADLYNYATNYIKLAIGHTDNNNGSLFSRSNVPAIVAGFNTALAIVILAEVVVMSYIFVRNNKNLSTSINKQYNIK